METTIKRLLRAIASLTLVAAVSMLHGCGGGGGGGSTPSGGTDDTPNQPGDPIDNTGGTTDPNDPTNTAVVPAPTATVVNSPQSARHHNVSLTFDDNGNGIAVWETGREYGIKLLYSIYDPAAGSWSAEKVLTSSAGVYGLDTFEYAVASTGSGFAVSWQESMEVYEDHLYATVYSNGNWSAIARIDNLDVSVGTHKVAASSGGYMVVWSQSQSLHYSLYQNGAWTTAATVSSTPSSSDIVELVSDGSGYLLGFCGYYCYNEPVSTTSYGGGSWHAPVTVTDVTSSVEFASNGTGYIAVWNDAGDLYWSSAGASTAWSAPALLVSSASSPVLVSNGSGYILAYETGSGSGNAVNAVVFDGTAWGAGQHVADAPYTSELSVGVNGSDYGLSWLSKTDLVTDDFYAAVVSGGVPGTPMLLEQGAQEVTNSALAATGSGYAYAWIQYDGAATDEVYRREYGSAGLSAQESLLQLAHDSPANRPVIAVNDTGQKIAVWNQDFFDPTQPPQYQYEDGLFASVYDSGTWGPPHLLSRYGIYPQIVSNGQSFMVVYQTISAGGSLYANVYADGAWSARQPLDGNVYDVGVVAGDTGYAVAWQANSSTDGWVINTRLYDDASGWEAGATRQDATTGSAYFGDLASNGSGYALSWEESDSNVAVPHKTYLVVYDGATGWSNTLISEDRDLIPPRIVSDGTGYLAAWRYVDNNELMVTLYTNQAWQTPQLLAASGNLSIASNGSGYAVVWANGDSVYANLFEGGAWLGEAVIAQSTDLSGASVRANDQGYMALWMLNDAASSFYARIHDGNGWQETTELIGQGVAITARLGNGAGYALAWYTHETGELGYRVYDGLAWQPAGLLENSDYPIGYSWEVCAVADGTGYSAVWTQPHRGYEDPAVPKIWYQSFGN